VRGAGDEGRIARRLEGGVGRVTAFGQVLVLHLAPHRFDRIQLGNVRRQQAEGDAHGGELREGVRHRPAVMHGIVVQQHHAGTLSLAGRNEVPDKGEMGGRSIRAVLCAATLEAQVGSRRIVWGQGASDVDAASLRCLIGHHQALAQPPPGGSRGKRRGEAALIEQPEIDQPGDRLFLSVASSATFAA